MQRTANEGMRVLQDKHNRDVNDDEDEQHEIMKWRVESRDHHVEARSSDQAPPQTRVEDDNMQDTPQHEYDDEGNVIMKDSNEITEIGIQQPPLLGNNHKLPNLEI